MTSPSQHGSLVKAPVQKPSDSSIALGFFMVFHPTLVQGRSHAVELVENVRPRSPWFFSSPSWSHYHVFGSCCIQLRLFSTEFTIAQH